MTVPEREPVRWRPRHGTELSIDDGALRLTNEDSLQTQAVVDGVGLFDTSLRTQISLSKGLSIGGEVRYDPSDPDHGYFTLLQPSGKLEIGISGNPPQVIAERFTDFDPMEEDVLMQLDAVDNLIFVTLWSPGGLFPDEPARPGRRGFPIV